MQKINNNLETNVLDLFLFFKRSKYLGHSVIITLSVHQYQYIDKFPTAVLPSETPVLWVIGVWAGLEGFRCTSELHKLSLISP